MIISHKHKFIFIKCRKTAGTSMEIALSKVCGTEDTITRISEADEAVRMKLGYRSAQNYLLPFHKYKRKDWLFQLWKLGRYKFYNHMTAREIRDNVTREIWDNYFKFCFERNPYDKVISHYYWRKGEQKYGSIANYLKSEEVNILKPFELYTIDNTIAVDRIFRYEKMDAALDELSGILTLPERLKLPKYKAKSGIRKDKRNYRAILTAEERALIEVIFAREIRLLNYQF